MIKNETTKLIFKESCLKYLPITQILSKYFLDINNCF